MARAGRFYYLHRFLSALVGVRRPITAVLKVTSRCNLACTHCPWPKGPEPDLDTAAWKRQIDQACDLGCICLCFEGGEPFLRPDLEELVQYGRNKGMLTFIITNGTLPMKDVHPDAMVVSLEGTEEAHDAVRGPGVYRRVLTNLQEIPGQYKVALMSLSQRNVHCLADTADAWAGMVDAVWYNFVYPYRGIRDEALGPDGAAQAGRTILELKKRHPEIINSDRYLGSVGRIAGCVPWWTYVVMPDGTSLQNCTVAQIEDLRCEACHLSCYREPYLAMRGSWGSIRFMQRLSGLPRLVFYR